MRKLLIIILEILLVILVVGSIVGIIVGVSSQPNKKEQSELAKVMKLNEEQEKEVLLILEKCGVGELVSVKQFQAGEKETSFHLEDKETIFYTNLDYTVVVWLDNETRNVKTIYFHDVTIYENNEVKAQITDYYISEDARNKYCTTIQMMVNKFLSYPKTAKYKNISKWAFYVSDDGYDCIQSIVTAKNAFGVEIEIPFSIKCKRNTKQLVSFIFNGEEYIK